MGMRGAGVCVPIVEQPVSGAVLTVEAESAGGGTLLRFSLPG